MKLQDIAEQLQKRRSPEELAAEKSAPDYWKKVARKELNEIIRKFGGTSREKARPTDNKHVTFDRSIAVLVTGENSMLPHRDIRAKALLNAIGRWLFKYRQQGYGIGIGYYGGHGGVSADQVNGTETLEKIMFYLKDAARIENTIDWLNQIGERGQKMPVRFDLRFTIVKPTQR